MSASQPPSPLRQPPAQNSTPATASDPIKASASASSSPSASSASSKRKGKLNALADASHLKIRAVPYSPPRLSSASSLSASSSRPGSYAAAPHSGREVNMYDHDFSPQVSPQARPLSPSAQPSHLSTASLAPTVLSAGTSDRVGAAGASVSDATSQFRRHTPAQSHSNRPTTALGMNSGDHSHQANDPGLSVNASSTSLDHAFSHKDRSRSAASSTGSNADENRSRSKRVITLHADSKTFSLTPLSGSIASRTDSSLRPGITTGPPSLATPSSSYGRVSSTSAFFTDDRPVSPLSSLYEHPAESHRGSATSPASTTTSVPDISTASPWNYRLLGGLRKVRQTSSEHAAAERTASDPERSRASSNSSNSSQASSPYALPPLPPLPIAQQPSPAGSSTQHALATQGSFESSSSAQSGSTLSERTNYKIYGQSSSVVAVRHRTLDLEPRSSTSSIRSDVNFRVLNYSSPSRPQHADLDASSSSGGRSDINYRILSRSSTVRSTSDQERHPEEDESFSPPSPGSNVNYQVYDYSSFQGDSSIDLRQAESEAYSSRAPSIDDHEAPSENQSEANLVIHPGASDLSLGTAEGQVREKFSRESLIVPPLSLNKKHSRDTFQLAAKRSRDSLRSGSLTSLGSILTQEAARVIFAGPAQIFVNPPVRQQRSRRSSSVAMHSGRSMIESHPHQWSSQLSTVHSESEPSSRSLSPVSDAARRSSGFMSIRSTRMRSISSSLAGSVEPVSRSASYSLSLSDSLERPQAAHVRQHSRDALGSSRQVRDHDEDGDGLADLQDLGNRPSRSGLGSLSHQPSDRSLKSRASSRSRSNSLKAQLPGWARLYYGSGEKRFVISHPSSESMYSLYNESPRSSLLNRTSSMERFMFPVRSSHRKPCQQSQMSQGNSIGNAPPRSPLAQSSSSKPEEQTTAAPHSVMQVARRIRKQTSSIWSPHLQYDKRASRYSLWEPPSTTQSDETGIIGRRNVQVALFIAGFVFPIAWMIAAFLPMPLAPKIDMEEFSRDARGNNVHVQEPQSPTSATSRTPYSSARWWRNLNRIMSVVGLLLIGAVVALAVVGVKQGWRA